MKQIWAEKALQIGQASRTLLQSFYPQILFGLGCVSCVYLMRKPQTQAQQSEIQASVLKTKKRPKRSRSLEKIVQQNDKQMIVADLKKSQLKINRKLNKKYDVSPDLTEEAIQPRSPDYSVVSEVDQRFFADFFHNQQKPKQVRNGYESETSQSFIRQNKAEIKQLAANEKGEDKLFFKLYQQVAEQSQEED
ncbi:hypothetical protein pb186bvf_006730 [Paramecium bursaria]